MTNVFDYILWRGDLSYEASPFNEIDSLIFARLSYLPFEGVDDENYSEFTPLNNFAINMKYSAKDTKGYVENDIKLLDSVIKSQRYNNTKIAAVISKHDGEQPTQFAAVTFKISKDLLFVSFRGTDMTVDGWKENFNMLKLSSIPAQRLAVEYLNKIAVSFTGEIIVGGHSKGGNLGIYAYLFSDDSTKKRIKSVYNMDGPGFNKEIINKIKEVSTEDVLSKINNFLPESSVVGVLLEREHKYNVIKSDGLATDQHNIYMWHIERDKFIYLEEISKESKVIEKTVNIWISEMELWEIDKFIDSFFEVITLSYTNNIIDLISNRRRTILSIVNQKNHADEKTKTILNEKFSRFRQISHNIEKVIR